MKSMCLNHLELTKEILDVFQNDHLVFLLQHESDPCASQSKQANTLQSVPDSEKQNRHDLLPFLFT